jgi:hypothetical protein
MSFRLLVAECARRYRSRRRDGDIGPLDVTELIDQCCGFADLSSPLSEEGSWGHTAYSTSLDALRKSMRDAELNWVHLFAHLPQHIPWLIMQVQPVVMLDPLPGGRIPFRGHPEQTSRAWLFGLLAAIEHELHLAALSRGGASAVAKHGTEWRSAALSLVADGNVDAYYKLGLDAARDGRSLEAKAWWSLAAEQRDDAAIRCLALLERRSGRIEASDYWLTARASSRGTSLSSFRFLAVLEHIGTSLRGVEPAAARACLRRSAQLGSRSAAVDFAIEMGPTDPVTSLLYLMAARRPIAEPVSEEDTTSFRRATQELERMRVVLGRRRYKRCLRKARTTFLALNDTRELP